MVAGAGMPVRNLPNTAKVWEAVQGDVRHGARASALSAQDRNVTLRAK